MQFTLHPASHPGTDERPEPKIQILQPSDRKKLTIVVLTSVARSCCVQCPHPGRITAFRKSGTNCFNDGNSWSMPLKDRTKSRSPAMYNAGTVTLAPTHGAKSSQFLSMLRYQLSPPRKPARLNSPV